MHTNVLRKSWHKRGQPKKVQSTKISLSKYLRRSSISAAKLHVEMARIENQMFRMMRVVSDSYGFAEPKIVKPIRLHKFLEDLVEATLWSRESVTSKVGKEEIRSRLAEWFRKG